MKLQLDILDGLSKYRSQMMGVAIIWIMLFHSGIAAPDNIALRAIWYLFVSFGGGCGVDLFFILSGFGLVYSASKISQKKDWLVWEGKRMMRLLPSYLIIAIVFYLLPGQGGVSVGNLLQISFLRDGIRQFWFIPAIFLCYLFFPFIFTLCDKIGHRLGLAIVLLLSIALYLAIFYCDYEYYKKIEIFLLRLPCFIAGIYLGFLSRNNDRKEYYTALIVSLILFAISFFINYPGGDRWIFTFGTILLLPFFVFLFNLVSLKTLHNTMQYFGKRSLQIYLIHVSIGGWLAGLANNTILSYLIYFIGSITMAEIIYRLTNPLNSLFQHK